MFLTGPEIVKRISLGQLSIEPFNLEHVGPNSVDVTLAPLLKVYADVTLDAARDNPTLELPIPKEGLWLHPGTLYLGSTVERTASDHLLPMLDGRSSTGRLGIRIHCTAGIGDVGFAGTWTCEIDVVQPVRVYPFMRIGQLRFAEVVGNVQLYRGRYQGQSGATASRMHRRTPSRLDREPTGLAKSIKETIAKHGEIDDGWRPEEGGES